MSGNDHNTADRQRLRSDNRKVKAAQQDRRTDVDHLLSFEVDKNFQVIAETNLEIDWVFLESDIAWITMEVISEKAKVELALAQSLRIINRK